MKAAVIQSVDVVSIEQVPDPTPGPRDVIVEVIASGICGTDLHILEGKFALSPFPIIPGHEFAGNVVAVGRDVHDVQVGTRVAVDPNIPCGSCHFCKRGKSNLCEHFTAFGINIAGGAAQFAKVPVTNLYVLPDAIATKNAGLIEPLSCAVHAFDALPRNPADHYLIYGSGTMGLIMMEMAKRHGSASVTMIDLNDARLETARQLGCTATSSTADAFDMPYGWDVVIDCTGSPAAIRDGLSRVAPGGIFHQFGVTDEHAKVEYEPFRVYNKEITIMGTMSLVHSFDRAGELLASGVLNPDVMISHRFSLVDYARAIEQFKAGVGRKITVEPNA